MAYTTEDVVLARLGSDATHQEGLAAEAPLAIAAAKQAIDNICNRSFDKSDEGTVREFRPDSMNTRRVFIGDVVSVDRVAIRRSHESPYVPLDAADWIIGLPGKVWPACDIWAAPYKVVWPQAAWPVNTVQATGVFGWPAVPELVQHVAMMLAIRFIRDGAPGLESNQEDDEYSSPNAARDMGRARYLLRDYRREGAS